MDSKQQRYNDCKFESLYNMMRDLQLTLGWARTAEERKAIHGRINEVMGMMNDIKEKRSK